MDSLDLALMSILVEEDKKKESGEEKKKESGDEVCKSSKKDNLLYSSVSSGEEEEVTQATKLKELKIDEGAHSIAQDSGSNQRQSLPSSSHNLRSGLPPKPSRNRSTIAKGTDSISDVLPVVGAGKIVEPDKEVLSVELVTRLARATAARVLLLTLTIDTHILNKLISSRNTASKRAKSNRRGVVTTGCATCIE